MDNLGIEEEGGDESTYCIAQTESDDELSLFANVESRNTEEVQELVVPEEEFAKFVAMLKNNGCYNGVTNQSQLDISTETGLNKIELQFSDFDDLFSSQVPLLEKNETTEFGDHQENSNKTEHDQQKPIISMYEQNELTLVDYLTSSTSTASTSNCLLTTEAASLEEFDSDRFMKVPIQCHDNNEKSAAEILDEKLGSGSDWNEGGGSPSSASKNLGIERLNQCAESENDFSEVLHSTSNNETQNNDKILVNNDVPAKVIVEVDEQPLDSSRADVGQYDVEVSIIDDCDDYTEEMFHCFVCERNVNFSDTKYSAPDLISHYRIYHRKKQKPFECFFPGCKWKFTSNYKLDRHLTTHIEPKKIRCTFSGCNKVFSHRDNLMVHKKQHKEAVCVECKLSFNGKREYKMHMRKKHNVGPKHKCGVCFQDFATRPALIQHEGTHKKKTKHMCKQCNKEFRSPSDLVEHSNYHNGQRPYKCSLCQWDFTCESRLRRHMNTHNKIKSIKCPICDKTFNRNEHLVGHMRVHVTSEMATSSTAVENFIQYQLTKALGVVKKYYHCKVDACKEGFLSFHRFQRHMKSVHGKTARKPENETKQCAKVSPATYYSDGKSVISSNIQNPDDPMDGELQIEMNLAAVDKVKTSEEPIHREMEIETNLADMENNVKSSDQSPSFYGNGVCEQSNSQFSFEIDVSRNIWTGASDNTSTSLADHHHSSSTPSHIRNKIRSLIPSYESYLIKSSDDNKSVDSFPIVEADLCTNSVTISTTAAASPVESYSTYKVNNTTSNETYTCEGEDVLSQYIQTPSMHTTVSTGGGKDNLVDDIQRYYTDQNLLTYTEDENQTCFVLPACSNVVNGVLTSDSDIPTNLVLTQNLTDMNDGGTNFLDEDLNSMTINLNDIK